MANVSPCLKVRHDDGITSVQFHDKQLLDEERIMAVKEELTALIADKQPPMILIDFYNIDHLSSSCLGTLVALQKLIKEKNGHLRLANIQPKLMKVFTITRLDTVLRISSTRTGAMNILQRIVREGGMESP